MSTQSDFWLPLTEYALRSGTSISTLRRKIKSNTIEYKMEDGRYLIRSDDVEGAPPVTGFTSNDAPREKPAAAPALVIPAADTADLEQDFLLLRKDVQKTRDEDSLRWRALEARVAGLAKKLELFSEQVAELKMLVKIFEETMDRRG